MRKEEKLTSVTSSNEAHDISKNKQTFLNQFSNWFKTFIDNAE